jgi:hypothetical protein
MMSFNDTLELSEVHSHQFESASLINQLNPSAEEPVASNAASRHVEVCEPIIPIIPIIDNLLQHFGPVKEESICTFVLQVLPSLFIAGCGMVAAGLLLDVVQVTLLNRATHTKQHWELFIEISELFILVPALLGLKGNLEMTMASRLSTCANLGELSSSSKRKEIILNNLALIQVGHHLVYRALTTLDPSNRHWLLRGCVLNCHGSHRPPRVRHPAGARRSLFERGNSLHC